MTTSTKPKLAVLLSNNILKISLGLSLAVAGLAFIAWGQGLDWRFKGLSSYKLFPLFGLLAWSLVWSMYIVGWMRRHYEIETTKLVGYYKVLPLLVVGLIMLHPGLLSWRLWRDGFGLPPGSYLKHYIAPSLKWAAILGTISFLVFMVYDLGRKLRDRSWWKYIEFFGDAAMVAIFIHALKLGGQLQEGWFRWVWWFYGLILMVILTDLYLKKLKRFVNNGVQPPNRLK